MKPTSSLLLLCLLSPLGVACDARVVAIEVLPPRTSATCAAPGLQSSAAARGLLDLEASSFLHGSYRADVRVTSRGEVRVDGLALSFTLPEGASSDSTKAADAASGEQVVGDLYLPGDDTDPTSGILEDVVLLPRALAVALRDDDAIEADETRYATVNVTLQALSGDSALSELSATFPIDVCRGCLVSEPSAEECPDGFEDTSACRPGQDVELYQCSTPPSAGGIFP